MYARSALHLSGHTVQQNLLLYYMNCRCDVLSAVRSCSIFAGFGCRPFSPHNSPINRTSFRKTRHLVSIYWMSFRRAASSNWIKLWNWSSAELSDDRESTKDTYPLFSIVLVRLANNTVLRVLVQQWYLFRSKRKPLGYENPRLVNDAQCQCCFFTAYQG